MFDALGDVVGVVTGVAGVGFALWRGRQLKKFVSESVDVVQTYRKARADGEVTPEEVDKLIDEIEQMAHAGVDVWKFWKRRG